MSVTIDLMKHPAIFLQIVTARIIITRAMA